MLHKVTLNELAEIMGMTTSHEEVKWHCHTLLEKFDENGNLDETLEIDGNLLTTAGANLLFTKLTGGAGTVFDATNAFISVGDGGGSVPTPAIGDTDLTASLAATKTITNATNATPISVTATSHGYSSGDTITVLSVGGNTAANGTWSITVVDANTFTLNSSVGNGAYTSGGTAQKGNRMRKAMDSTYPQVSTNTCIFRSTYGANDGNFAWNEWGLFNSFTTGTMLNHKGQSLGTKGSGATWVFTVTLSLA